VKSLWPYGIALFSALALVGVGLAQAPGTQAVQLRELFLELDANHDGAIEKAEVPASGHAAFDRLLKQGDADHNGKLEAKEYQAVLEELKTFNEQARKKAVQRFKAMDKDRDGKVSRAEFTGPKERFDLFDRNGDGLLTEQEFLGGVPAKAVGKKKAATKKKAAVVKKAD
jgi:Ca2+-binding EF-hand superfamily protein